MTTESFRKEIAEKLDRISRSEDPQYSMTFPSCLSAEDRKYIHHVAEKLGLRHKSTGKGDGRQLVVSKDPGRLVAGPESDDIVSPLLLPQAAWDALAHPLVLHAAKQGNTDALAKGAPLMPVTSVELGKLMGDRSVKTAGKLPTVAGPLADACGPPPTELLPVRQALPAWGHRQEILQAIESHQVTLVLGETGCGKSTQVPQFIIEHFEGSNVFVTQPRRISALALATRISEERDEEVGQSAGYSVHLDNRSSSSTRILFCTTGVFRRRLLSDANMSQATHIILDELHERDKVTDFLLISVRELLAHRPALRVILMSATMKAETFQQYFAGCAVVSIGGRTFPVRDLYLEDFVQELHQRGHWKQLGPGFAAGGRGYGSFGARNNEKSFKYQVLVSHARDRDGVCGYANTAQKELTGSRLEEGLFLHDVLQQTKGLQFDFPIVEALLTELVRGNMGSGAAENGGGGNWSGAVLVFLPGWDDIDQLKRRLQRSTIFQNPDLFWILPLHSQIALDQQKKIFVKPPAGVTKIILSTNISETSITIDDVEVVIDCGRVKETSYDNFLRVPTLNTSWVSKASLAQRAGRAGRTKPGLCYHLLSRRRLAMMDSHRPPEMLRSPLEDICLHAKVMLTRRGEPEIPVAWYLAKAPDPPEAKSVQNAEFLLREIGALTSHQGGADAGTEGQLTALGAHLAKLPLAPQMAKFVIWARLLGVGEDAVDILGALQYREPFVGIGDARQPLSLVEANRIIRTAKQGLCGSHLSDHVALLKATQGFEIAQDDGIPSAREFCDRHSLHFKHMCSVRKNCRKLRDELRQHGLKDEETCDDSSMPLLISALCAGLFPNIAQKSAKGKLWVNNGRLEAVPHLASVIAKAPKHSDDTSVDNVDEGGVECDGRQTSWYCFNELSQVEEHYSVVGISAVPVSAILLLCGEGDLILRDANLGGAAASQDPHEDFVVLSILELGEWFSIRVHRKTAAQLQGLRAMLRLVFRAFVSDPANWDEVAQQTIGAPLVLSLVSRIICAEMGSGGNGKGKPENGGTTAPPAVSMPRNMPAKQRDKHIGVVLAKRDPNSGKGKAKSTTTMLSAGALATFSAAATSAAHSNAKGQYAGAGQQLSFYSPAERSQWAGHWYAYDGKGGSGGYASWDGSHGHAGWKGYSGYSGCDGGGQAGGRGGGKGGGCRGGDGPAGAQASRNRPSGRGSSAAFARGADGSGDVDDDDNAYYSRSGCGYHCGGGSTSYGSPGFVGRRGKGGGHFTAFGHDGYVDSWGFPQWNGSSASYGDRWCDDGSVWNYLNGGGGGE